MPTQIWRSDSTPFGPGLADQDHFSLSGPGLARIRAILDHSGDFLEHFWSTILYYQAREGAPGVSGFPVSYQACGREAPSTHPESLYPRLFGRRLARSKNFRTFPAPLGPGLTSSEHLFFRAQFVLKGIFSGPADDAQEQALRNRYSHSAHPADAVYVHFVLQNANRYTIVGHLRLSGPGPANSKHFLNTFVLEWVLKYRHQFSSADM